MTAAPISNAVGAPGELHKQPNLNIHHRTMKVVVTGTDRIHPIDRGLYVAIGASGFLGAQVRNAFDKSGHQVIGLSHTRSGNGLIQLDLTNEEEVDKFFEGTRPECTLFL